MLNLSRGRFRAPTLALFLGTGIAVAVGIGQGWQNAIPVEVIAVIGAVGYFLVGGMNNDIGAIYGSGADERQQLVRLRAQALAAVMTALAAVVGYLVQIARGASAWPFAVIAGVAAASFVAGLAIYRGREAG